MKKTLFLLLCSFHCTTLYSSSLINNDQALHNESLASSNSENPLLTLPYQYTGSVESPYPLLPGQGFLTPNYTPFSHYPDWRFNPHPFLPIAVESPSPLNAFYNMYRPESSIPLFIPNSPIDPNRITNSNTNNNANTPIQSYTNQINGHSVRFVKKTEENLHEPKRKTHKCDFCGKELATSGSLKDHIGTHNPNREKPYECLTCNKKFYRKNALKKHKKTLHEGKRDTHKCNLCGKELTTHESLKDHIKRHNPSREKPYECPTCNKSYYARKDLNYHLQTHAGEKAFECLLCLKKLATKETLRSHIKAHLKIKPWKCEKCNKRFIKKFALKDHIKTHKEAKPYKCKKCEKSYVNQSGLWKHLKNHHQESHSKS